MISAFDLYGMGYRQLVSVIPPGAVLSPNSKIPAMAIGKVPGIHGQNGWAGYNWVEGSQNIARQEAIMIDSSGANVGLSTRNFPAVDIDCLDEALVSIIRRIAFTVLGQAPERIGRAPKALLLYRTDAPFGRMRLWMGPHLIEILGDGQQFVAAGVHPTTTKPYIWPHGLCSADELPVIDRDLADKFLTAVADAAEMLGYVCSREGRGGASIDRDKIDQEKLVGDFESVSHAMSVLPNTNDLFPGRDDYLRVGYAIKAALGDEGFDLFEAWAIKWEGNDREIGNDPDTVLADWERMKPPFEVGAEYLYEIAQPYGFNWAASEFDAEDDPEPDAVPIPAVVPIAAAPVNDDDDHGGAGGGPIHFSDAALADILLKQYGAKLRYSAEEAMWYSWTGAMWEETNNQIVREWSGYICRKASNFAILTIADATKAEKVASRVASNATKNAVVDYARDSSKVRVKATDFDADPWLLNTPKVVVNLKTGEMSPPNPKLLMSRVTSVSPEHGQPELWLKFLDEATGGDKDLQGYLKRLVGYALTGDKSEHNLAFIYGTGGNGKGVFLNTVANVMHTYAEAAAMNTFTASKYDAHPTELADLAGARLVTAQETEEGRRWDEPKLKLLTGNDPVKARFMRENFFSFIPNFKLIFAGNHKPEIRNLDEAIRRRFHLVPFNIKPKVKDFALPEKLKAEYPQILMWMIDGCREWQKYGLRPPESVIEASNEYFTEEDPLGQWISEATEADMESEFVASSVFFESWRQWAGENGEPQRTVKWLVRALRDRNWRAIRRNTGRGFYGHVLKHGTVGEFLAEDD